MPNKYGQFGFEELTEIIQNSSFDGYARKTILIKTKGINQK